ncbi:alpha/beta-hydrolase [Macrophomina phaseolina]|uniref:Alpha/beta-hydrolase n=1 Tax=Macrophomina phaseolina TaxID=35725 RepID=A0ABQ8G252_9PEZI|nr:alpha/beta-hydrolase [Macrophomina phaseolina]
MSSPQEQQTSAAAVQTLTLPCGTRTLSYAIYGSSSPTAPTILYFHGFPASHAEAASYHAPALARGLRIVAPDRPGMGHSTFQPQRALLDWPADVLALADHLRLPSRVAILAVSGGAPYALACCAPASALRDRVAAVGIVSGLFPARLGLAGMLPDARALLWVAPWCPRLVQWGIEWGLGAPARDEANRAALEELVGRGMAARPPPDRRVWDEDEAGFRANLVESMRGALRESAAGAAWEARLFGCDWGFGLEQVAVRGGEGRRIVLWHGALDVNSPVAMAEKAAALMEGVAELRVEPEEAHASLAVRKVDEVLDTLKGLL